VLVCMHQFTLTLCVVGRCKTAPTGFSHLRAHGPAAHLPHRHITWPDINPCSRHHQVSAALRTEVAQGLVGGEEGHLRCTRDQSRGPGWQPLRSLLKSSDDCPTTSCLRLKVSFEEFMFWCGFTA